MGEHTSYDNGLELGPESRDRAGRTRHIIDAALSLFAEEGYGPVSTRRIADRAGCSETLLFRYFGGKHGLLVAISRELLDETRRQPTRSRPPDNLREYLEEYLVGGFAGMREAAPSLKVIVSALVNEPELAADYERRHEEAVTDVEQQLQRFQDAGAIASHLNLRAIATGIEQMQFAVGFLMQIVYGRSQEELAEIARTLALALCQGLQGDKPTSPFPEALYRQTVDSARRTSEGLDRMVALLNRWEPDAAADGKR